MSHINLPSNEQNKGQKPQNILISLVFGRERNLSRNVVPLQPPELRTGQQDEAEKESRQKPANVSEVIDVW